MLQLYFVCHAAVLSYGNQSKPVDKNLFGINNACWWYIIFISVIRCTHINVIEYSFCSNIQVANLQHDLKIHKHIMSASSKPKHIYTNLNILSHLIIICCFINQFKMHQNWLFTVSMNIVNAKRLTNCFNTLRLKC